MADRENKIRIVTTADPTGLQHILAGTSQLTGETVNVAAANEEHHKSFLHVASGARELHRIEEKLTEAAPQVGFAFKAFLGPVGALMAILGFAIGHVSESLKALGQSLTTTEWESYNSVVETAKRGFEESKIAAATFAGEIEHIR